MKVLYIGKPGGLNPWYTDFVKALDGQYPIEVYDPDKAMAEQFKGVAVVLDPGGTSRNNGPLPGNFVPRGAGY